MRSQRRQTPASVLFSVELSITMRGEGTDKNTLRIHQNTPFQAKNEFFYRFQPSLWDPPLHPEFLPNKYRFSHVFHHQISKEICLWYALLTALLHYFTKFENSKLPPNFYFCSYHHHQSSIINLRLLAAWQNANQRIQRDAALPNIGSALYSTPQSLADAHY